MTPQAGLFLSAIAFVGLHFLLSHPLRAPLVGRLGEKGFQGFYSVQSLLTFGLMIYFYRAIGREPPVWTAGEWVWAVAVFVMWLGAILFVGSFLGNPALPGAKLDRGKVPAGVFAITRHPMMWGFATWAAVHLTVIGTAKAMVFDGALILLAIAGSIGQDAKKEKLMGERFHEWAAQTAFVPFSRGLAWPGTAAFVGGTLLFLVATWLHPFPVGIWRWIG
ncbi:MAG: NnrU family protein [Pseudomonadota bacterium]